jgi:hypothetical protein
MAYPKPTNDNMKCLYPLVPCNDPVILCLSACRSIQRNRDHELVDQPPQLIHSSAVLVDGFQLHVLSSQPHAWHWREIQGWTWENVLPRVTSGEVIQYLVVVEQAKLAVEQQSVYDIVSQTESVSWSNLEFGPVRW